MKKLLLSTAAIAAMGMFAGSAQAGSSSTATASASATVVEPIVATNTQSMSFGAFAVNGTGSVTTGGTYTNTVRVPNSSDSPAHAIFSITGADGFAYTLTSHPASVAFTTTATGTGTDTMSADLTYVNGTTLDDTITVSGDLGVADNQIPGVYNGSFDITVAYN